LALLFSSALGTLLLFVRVLVSHRLEHLYLVGNLALAWIPLLASMLLESWDKSPLESAASAQGAPADSASSQNDLKARAPRAAWKRTAAYVIWFFFFPNAPYIVTDLVHLGPKQHGHFWIDMLLILLFALTGLVLAFLSLRLMQRRVERRCSWTVGWLFVAGMSFLCGMGIYAGRFLRWNSWDVILRPWLIISDLQHWLRNFIYHPLSIAFPVMFALFLFTIYLTLLAITHAEQVRRHATFPIREVARVE